MVYCAQLVLLVGALAFNQYAANFLICSIWVVAVVWKIGKWWSGSYLILLALLTVLTLQDPFQAYRWGLIPVALVIFHVYLAIYIFSRVVRNLLSDRLSLADLTLYMGHRVIGAYSFSKIIDESSPEVVAAHNPLEVMNSSWVYSAGIVDFIVALAAPVAAYLLCRYSARPAEINAESKSAALSPIWLLLLVALINVVGFADFCVVGAGYSSLLLPGPFQMENVTVSVIPMTRFPVAVLVMGLAPVSMLFHIVSVHRVVMLLRKKV